MMPPGVSGNSSRTISQIRSSSTRPVPSVSTCTLTGSRNADGVGQLHFAAIGQAGRHDVLGDVPGHVGGAAIDLGGILAAERAAAVTTPAAVGIDDDLAAGQSGIAVRTADHESARGIDVILDVAVDQFLRQARLDDAG